LLSVRLNEANLRFFQGGLPEGNESISRSKQSNDYLYTAKRFSSNVLTGMVGKVLDIYNNARLARSGLVDVSYIAETTTRMSWFVYGVRLDPRFDRDSVIRKPADRRIPAPLYFMPILLQPFNVERLGYRPGDLPVTEMLSDVSLYLHFSGVMSEDQVDYVYRNLLDIEKNVTGSLKDGKFIY